MNTNKRYKVEHDYPNSRFSVGTIIEVIYPESFLATYPDYGSDVLPTHVYLGRKSFADYPHLFREMAWWEELPYEELPRYYKVKNGNTVIHSEGIGSGSGGNMHILWHQPFDVRNFAKGALRATKISLLLPAESSDYTAYLSNK